MPHPSANTSAPSWAPCWRLGSLPEYEPLHLRTWTHTLGYRGHILTKSRAYSTTYAVLRAERAHHVGHIDIPDAITDAHWRYVGSGHTPGAAIIAAGIAEDLATSREAPRDTASSSSGGAVGSG
ncbi:replication initiator [Streptomyces sp. NBC_01210]|uniref:replication initiator n=1 Tax=Streptomyces sp. NBC_01210 TaxID=2903774 RepID=UPI002E0D8E62